MSHASPSSPPDSMVHVTVQTLQHTTSIVESPSPVYDLTGPLDLTEGMEATFEEASQRYGDSMDIPGIRTQLGKRPAANMVEGNNTWKKVIKLQARKSGNTQYDQGGTGSSTIAPAMQTNYPTAPPLAMGQYPPLFGSFINQGFPHQAYVPQSVVFTGDNTQSVPMPIFSPNLQEGELGFNEDVST